MKRLALILLLTTACGRGLDAPWEDASATQRILSGRFDATLGGEQPGYGVYDLDAVRFGDLSRASLVETRGTWSVVQIEVLDHSEAGWSTVELDVALNHWIAGDIPLDGTEAVGRYTDADGSAYYLTGGTLTITHPGVAPGERVSGTFSDVVLAIGGS